MLVKQLSLLRKHTGFQGYNKNFAIYGIVPDYITKAITGEMSLDDALAAIDADVAAKIAE